jgi:hypothetical protein
MSTKNLVIKYSDLEPLPSIMFDNRLDDDGEMEIEIRDYTPFPSWYFCNKDQAQAIVNHLTEVFNLGKS